MKRNGRRKKADISFPGPVVIIILFIIVLVFTLVILTLKALGGAVDDNPAPVMSYDRFCFEKVDAGELIRRGKESGFHAMQEFLEEARKFNHCGILLGRIAVRSDQKEIVSVEGRLFELAPAYSYLLSKDVWIVRMSSQ